MKILLLSFALFFTATEVLAQNHQLFFVENVGQLSDQFHKPRHDIDVAMKTSGMSVFIGSGKIQYQFVKPLKTNAPDIPDFPFDKSKGKVEQSTNSLETFRIDVELVGASKSVTPVMSGQLKYYERFYFPQFGEEGALAHTYSRITYPEIYPHIDWILYINGNHIEYDFVIKEGGDPGDIQIEYNGTTALNLDAEGNLVAGSPIGTITEHAPISYQSDGKKVVTSFKLFNSVVSYNVASYTGTLLIDPYVEWATYYGGAGEDGAGLLTQDASENIYLMGSTRSGNNIATIGAHNVSYADSQDIFIVKFDNNGTRLWATYYGGTGYDGPGGIAYDHHGGIVICGVTDNVSGIATVSSDQPVFSGPYLGDDHGGGDGFIAKFDSTGFRQWATYFGGNDQDYFRDITCDHSGNIYLVGGASSLSNVATPGTHKPIISGSYDGFLVKYNTIGQKVWGTYFGGNFSDAAYGIAIAPDDNIYICGSTNSIDGIATPGGYQPNWPGSDQSSGYLAAFNNNGTQLWGTYFGGTGIGGFTLLYSISCDSNNDVFVTGLTKDEVGMVTSGCHQPLYGGTGPNYNGDAIIAKFSSTGNRIWSTYFGGSGDDYAYGIAHNTDGEVYVVGSTTSTNNIAINAFQGNYGGGGAFDGWMAKLSSSGSCVWSTYWGGNQDDFLTDILPVSSNGLYVSGGGMSLPTTSNAHQQYNAGQADAYLVKFYDFPTGVAPFNPVNDSVKAYPVPNKGSFTVSGCLSSSDELVSISIFSINGGLLYFDEFKSIDKCFTKQINLGDNAVSGVYLLQLVSGNQSVYKRITIEE